MKAHLFLQARVVALIAIGICLSVASEAQDCNCPQFQIVSGLEMVKAGDTVEFEVSSTVDLSVLSQKYEWTVSAGTIIRGQGTGKVVVQTTEEMLYPKPEPTPSPLPESFLGSISIHPRIPKLTVTATPVVPDCSCRSMSASIRIGRENRETNKPANVTDIILSSDNLTLACPAGHIPHPNSSRPSASLIVNVSVTAHDPEDDILTYNYTISGGRIVGTGANVKWDMSGVYPGSYTITAGVDDGCGICGKTQTKTLTVEACNNIIDCQCASVEIRGPVGEVLKAGENVFTANVTAGTYDPTYEWSVDGGEIVSGQGTPSITARFDEKTLRSKRSITVRIGGAPTVCDCPTEQVVEFVNGRRKV